MRHIGIIQAGRKRAMIAIGVQMGGPDQKDSPIDKALSKAMNIAARVRDEDYRNGTKSWVNPIFIVPGSIWKPDFEGYKLGYFSRKEKGLVVQIAVPQIVANGEGITKFVGESLRESVKLAFPLFTSKGISFSTLRAEKIIAAIEAGLE